MRLSSIHFGIGSQIAQTTQLISRGLERLASGKRVSRPADDPASFAQITRLDSHIRGLRQIALNLNHGKAFFNTMSSALSSQIEIVHRMREISIQASSSTLSESQREALSAELKSLREEFANIIETSEFNGKKLLDGSTDSLSFLVGNDSSQDISFNFQSQGLSDVFKKLASTETYALNDSIDTTALAKTIATGDFDNDGNLDVIHGSGATVSGIDIGFGDGEGGFRESEVITDAATNIGDITVADFNNDGRLDFATADRADNTVSVYLGNGDGSFATRVTYSTGGRAFKLAYGDFNGDGYEDIVSLYMSGSSTYLSGRLNNGDGSFAEAITALIGGGAAIELDLSVGDLNDDGLSDIVIAGATGINSSNIRALLSEGDGNFTISDAMSSLLPHALNVGDVNGDGILDIVALVRNAGFGSNSQLETYLGDGSGGFGSVITTDLSINPTGQQLELADFNGDGRLDVLMGHSTGAELRLGDGGGRFGQNILGVTGDVEGVFAGDFNKDGVMDLALSSNASGTIGIYLSGVHLETALNEISVASVEKAQSLTQILDISLERLSGALAKVGAYSERLDYISDHNLLQSESLADAKSRIEDADISLEVSELVRNQILQQAQIAVLGQANINAQLVLELLL